MNGFSRTMRGLGEIHGTRDLPMLGLCWKASAQPATSKAAAMALILLFYPAAEIDRRKQKCEKGK